MNVVHVVESLAVGGLERVVVSLASWQRARGDESAIVCLFHEGALAEEARLRDIDVIAIGKTPGPDLQALAALRAALKSRSAEVLHTHNAVAHYYAVAAAAGLGIGRVINTRHGMGPARGDRRLDLLYRLAMLGTDKAAAVCRPGRDRFVQGGVIPSGKSVVVANGVDVAGIAVRSDRARAELLAQLGRDPASIVLGVVGRLSPVKDHETLLRAIRLLLARGRPVQLAVVGDGETRPALEASARALGVEASVHFLGMRRDVAQLLASFDVFVLSSTSEGYSVALVEAAAAALPIVATRVGGNADIVIDRTTGLLVPSRDEEALAGALVQLVDDASLRRKMGDAGRAWALRYGSVDAMGEAYRALYGGMPVDARPVDRSGVQGTRA